MPTHKAVLVESAGAPLTLGDVDTASPSRDHVRIAVKACGVCGTDHAIVNGAFPGMSWPLTPGHEAAGTIAELGEGVEGFEVGDRVAVGWFGGNCNKCVPCRKGKFMQCEKLQVPSLAYPGGYAESITVPATALARIPDELSFAEAAPMGCAGVTTFNGLRQTKAVAGTRRGARRRWPWPPRCAIRPRHGLRDRRHRARRREGRRRTRTRAPITTSTRGRPTSAPNCTKLGGASVVLATAANSAAIGQTVGGLAPQGELVVVGVTPDPLPISPIDLITPGRSVSGHPSGTARDVEETMHFAVQAGVRAQIEERTLGQAAEAYAAMDEGRARYRMVLTM